MRLSLVRACLVLPDIYEFQPLRNPALAGYFTVFTPCDVCDIKEGQGPSFGV